MFKVPHLQGVSRPWSLSLPLVFCLRVPACLWENGPPLLVPMADPLLAPVRGPRPLGRLRLCHPTLCLCCPASPPSDTPVSVSSFLKGESLQISPADLVLLPGPHLPAGFLWLSLSLWEISVSLSLCISDAPSLLVAHLSVCLDLPAWVWVTPALSLCS